MREAHKTLFFCEDFLLEDHRNSVPDCPFCRGMELEEETNRLQAKLSLYSSWQTSDPGTKEAMEWAAFLENMFRCQPERRPTKDEANLIVLAHSHRAAMVRLEEAEKLIAVLKKTPYTLSGPNGAETLAAWEVYNGKP
jgi:hypothetical protein